MSPTVKPLDISAAICEGITRGNAPFLQVLVDGMTKRHALNDQVQTNVDKLWELDGEIKLMKGSLRALVGDGDGESGLIPRMQGDVRQVGEDLGSLKTDMKLMKTEVEAIRSGIGNFRKEMTDEFAAIREDRKNSKAFMDGWKGVGIALGIMFACIGAVGTMAAGCIWLYSHGGK